MHKIKRVGAIIALAVVLGLGVGAAYALDVSGLMKEIGGWYYKRFLAPANVFSDIMCERCDMSTEWLVEADISAFNANELDFLRLEKMLDRKFTSGDILELCNGVKCAVYVYTGKAPFAGRPWTLVKPAYKDVHKKYRNVSFVNNPADPSSDAIAHDWAITYRNGFVNTKESNGSVDFPREIYCPGVYCAGVELGDHYEFMSRIDRSDTLLMLTGLQAAPSADIYLNTNTVRY